MHLSMCMCVSVCACDREGMEGSETEGALSVWAVLKLELSISVLCPG